MANIAFEIPSEIKKILSDHPEIKWDKVVTDTLWNYAKKIRLMDKIVSKSKLSIQDVDKLNKTVKARLLKHYRKT